MTQRLTPTILAFLLTAAPAMAQRGGQAQRSTVPPVDSTIVKRAGTGFVVNFDDQPLRIVFSALAEASGLNVVQTNIPAKNTTLHMGQPVTRDQMLDVIKGVAASNGVTVVEGASLVRLDGPTPPPTQTVQQGAGQGRQQADQFQQQLFIYRLKHASAVQLAPVLQTLFNGASRTVQTQQAAANNPIAALLGGFAGNGGFGVAAGANQGAGGQAGGNAGGVAGGGAGGGGNAGGAGNFGGGRGGGRGAVLQQLAQAQQTAALSASAADIRIEAEESSNSLLIRATQADYNLIQQVLGTVDLRPLQVLIEVTIAEVTRTHDLNLGITGTASKKATTTNGTSISVVQPLDSSSSVRNFILELMGGNGSVKFDVAINALQSRGDVKILSLPVIIAENNRQAVLNVGSSRPFVQVSQSALGVAGGVVQTIQYIDVGTVLTITPTINPDGYVNLQVTQTANSATNEIQFDAPVINKREATTQVFIRDGQTTVVGGLAGNSDSRSKSGIPFLSQIPFIGWVFGNHQVDQETTELFLFLTPHVIFTDTDVDKLREAVKDGSELLQNVNTGARIIPKADTISIPKVVKPDTTKKKPPVE